MSLFLRSKSGATRLSEIEIDADKDWQGRLIRNLGGIDSSMQPGDIIYRGQNIFERLPLQYGNGYNVLKALNQGGGRPGWLDIQELIVYMTGAVNRVAALPLLEMPRPLLGIATAEDHSGGAYAAVAARSIQTPDISIMTGVGLDVSADELLSFELPVPVIGAAAQIV
ncbi:hypothetical protein Dform_00285 [Dehalogenimonas formicexedens]|uniref:Uncharacterized protein n=1 Tax=Dehalogenimonas formicexedens TaxID=1839801 RepID=A0A1P8F5C0_9CHLR|nr:hypothetical protein [Dehalogenimonas formicexedens]APV43645.1 hypothetical protein Dform_00285 [Dehalogenimonas formicexedens]